LRFNHTFRRYTFLSGVACSAFGSIAQPFGGRNAHQHQMKTEAILQNPAEVMIVKPF